MRFNAQPMEPPAPPNELLEPLRKTRIGLRYIEVFVAITLSIYKS